MQVFCCPNGHPIKGTRETLPACAPGNVARINGKIEITYDGPTQIWWDNQKTVQRNGQTVFVCDEGCECLESELIETSLDDENSEGEE